MISKIFILRILLL